MVRLALRRISAGAVMRVEQNPEPGALFAVQWPALTVTEQAAGVPGAWMWVGMGVLALS
jgi:hypothetical protein